VQLDNQLLENMKLNRKDVDLLVNDRATARTTKDFLKSDEIRKKLTELGISVSDLAEGSFWEVTK
jgi:cysteinyl-tRNA synthetase